MKEPDPPAAPAQTIIVDATGTAGAQEAGAIQLREHLPETMFVFPLRKAVANAPDMPMIAVMLGHALVASEDPKNFAEAKQILKVAVNRDNDNPFAWYQLGIVYDREGDSARAALATAERSNLEGQNRLALASARVAMAGLPQGTPDYLRAQDIAMVSENALKKDKKRREPKE